MIYFFTKNRDTGNMYNFPYLPGIGLPAQAFCTGVPIWDDCIQHSTLKNFPRVSGAQRHAMKNELGIPVSCSTGRFIVAPYTSHDIIK